MHWKKDQDYLVKAIPTYRESIERKELPEAKRLTMLTSVFLTLTIFWLGRWKKKIMPKKISIFTIPIPALMGAGNLTSVIQGIVIMGSSGKRVIGLYQLYKKAYRALNKRVIVSRNDEGLHCIMNVIIVSEEKQGLKGREVCACETKHSKN